MTAAPTLSEQVHALVAELRGPLGLERWQIRVETAALTDARAAALAAPEYRELVITVDLDKLETGDELREIVAHELTHAQTWELHAVAEELANALAEGIPEALREAVRAVLLERVRIAAERVTTDVGQTYVRLLDAKEKLSV